MLLYTSTISSATLRAQRERMGMSKMMDGIETSQFINSDSVKVSFEILSDDWCLFLMSQTGKRFQNYLKETQSRSSQMSLKEKISLLE